ncbi:sulfate transporter family-domain-containing protein, partial [Zopfochytrium polystomum]
MQTYKARDILTDFLSGVTVSVVLLPQAIAFSGLAGVEPIQELISSFYVLLFYLVFGGSIGLAVGPEASVAIITGVTIMEQIEETTLTAAQIGTLLALIVGVLCVLMSVLKMGFVDQILSGFLLIGFVTGVANLIIIEQMPNLFGLPGSVLAGEDSTIGKLTKVIKAGNLISGATVAVSISNIAFLFTVKYLKKTYFHGNAIVSRIPEILVLVVTMIACSALLDFKGRGIPTIGTFKNTIPKPTFPPLELALVMKLITPSVIITLVGFIECQTVTKMYGMKHGGAPTGDRELFALGFANILGSIFGCLPMFASLPRSRVLAGTKPVSMLGNAFAGVLVLMMSQLLVPALQFLPKATLGSIVTVATLGLIEIKEMRFAVQMRSWTEIGMMTLTYAVTLITTIANGVLVCLGLSALMIVRKTTTSVMSVMGRVPVSSSSRDSSDNDFRS